MKKRNILFGLLLMLMAAWLSGCGREEEKAESGYKIYYVSTTGTRLVEVSYEPAAQTFEEMMTELMGQMAEAPTGYVSALAGGVTYNGYERGIDALRVDFSQEYYSLNNIEEVLLRAAVIKTVSQISGVTKVMITVNGTQLTDGDGQPVGALDANSFIDTQEGGINSYLSATLVLYFADSAGESLVQEHRNMQYSSNMVLERLVVEQLIEGPDDSSGKAIFTKNVSIQNLYVQDGICTINLDAEANKSPSEPAFSPELVLQAVTDSIFATCDSVTGVKFEINGDSDVLFRDTVDLNQIFTAEGN